MRWRPIRGIPIRVAEKVRQAFILDVTATIQGPGVLPQEMRLDGQGKWGAYYTLRRLGKPFKHGLVRFQEKPGSEEVEQAISDIVDQWRKRGYDF